MEPATSRDANVPRHPPRLPAARIVVKEVNWLGDVVMSLPALRAVRRAYPSAHLAVLVKQELASFFDGSAWVDEVIPYRIAAGVRGLADRGRVVRMLRAGHYDLAVLLPRSFEAAFWVWLARVPRRAGFSTDGRSVLLTDRTPFAPALQAQHQMHDYLHQLQGTLGIVGSANEYTPDVHEPHRATMREWLATRRQRPQSALIALAVAAAYGPAKEWPAERYAALIDVLAERHGAECVLVGAPSERGKGEQVVAASRHGALIAAGETSVGQAIALLALCNGFAGNDSGAMHVAGALGIPTVGLYGSTRPERTSPLGPKTRVLYHQIDCSPCMARTCRFGHYDCLRRIAADEVAAALAALGAFA